MKKTRRLLSLIMAAVMLTLYMVTGVWAEDVIITDDVIGVIEPVTVEDIEIIGSDEELIPMMASDCDDIDYEYYSQNYPISASLQGCDGYDSDFVASGAAFYRPMTNSGLELYFQLVSPGTWKKGYQNGYCDGVKYSIHYFKNITTGSAYSGYKLKQGWVN